MFNRILIPIDLAHKEQLPRLLEAARLLIDGQGAIRLLYVDPILVHKAGSPQLGGSHYAAHEQEAQAHLQQLAMGLEVGDATLSCATREGPTHDQILEEAGEINADAILMMAKKPGFSSYFIGSTAERVVRHADCSVFVIRE